MMKPAFFLDRDGVLCKEEGYILSIEEMHIFEYAKECIQRIHKAGYLAVCITNQSAVARGLLEEKELLQINDYLEAQTGVDALYYCPHHPEGFGKYRKYCICRKPETGLILKAKQDFKIDMEWSFMVGDRAADILCGQRAGLRTVLLESGYGTRRLEQKVTADYVFHDLREVVEQLL